MNIAVNLLPFRKKLAGAGKYAKKILEELSKIDSSNEYYLFITKDGKVNFNISSGNFHFIYAKFDPDFFLYRIFWEQAIFPFKLTKLKPDILFTPSVAIPFFYRGKFFTTIHDLAYKKSIHKYPLTRKLYLKAVTGIAVKKSIIIFTVSNFSKKEIENEFSMKNKRVLITYNGVDEIFLKDYPSIDILNVKNKYNLPENFILYVGVIEPSKNLDKLFIAFSELLKKYDLNYNLAITSGMGWNQQNLVNLMDDLKIRDKIIFLPYLPEAELPLIYKASKMLAYLSNYEGFGIPVLEALAAGTPVITSKSKAILEFSEDSVISVNPENIEEIVEGMHKIINDLNFVNSLSLKGKIEAQKFTWANSAKVIYDQISSYKNIN